MYLQSFLTNTYSITVISCDMMTTVTTTWTCPQYHKHLHPVQCHHEHIPLISSRGEWGMTRVEVGLPCPSPKRYVLEIEFLCLLTTSTSHNSKNKHLCSFSQFQPFSGHHCYHHASATPTTSVRAHFWGFNLPLSTTTVTAHLKPPRNELCAHFWGVSIFLWPLSKLPSNDHPPPTTYWGGPTPLPCSCFNT